MASTVTKSKLTVVINEEISLNGKDHGCRTEFKAGNINEISNRIVTAPTSEITLLALGATAGAGTYVRSNVRYIRITNLDDKNFVRLTLTTAATQADINLPAARSFLLASTGLSIATPFAALADITDIKVTADTAACDVELFVASV